MRIDVYTFINDKGELLKTFDNIENAVAFATMIGKIPGNKIGLIILVNDIPVDIMMI